MIPRDVIRYRERLAMLHTTFRPLLRKASGRKPQASRPTRSGGRIARQELIERRDHCMAEIARLSSEAGNSGSLFEKARQLLTRHWSTSTWRARTNLIRTAEWLISIGKKGAESTTHS
jgi:hypothetical protein